MQKIEKQILEVLDAQLVEYGGFFIRFIDNDKMNPSRANLSALSAVEAFSHPEWTVDWDIDLSEEQFEYVQANMSKFLNHFKQLETSWDTIKNITQSHE